MRLGHVSIVILVATGVLLGAQAPPPEVKLPASPRGTAAIQVGGSWAGTGDDRRYTGGSWITVDYGRPILRGRENIFGAGATYGKTANPDSAIWRAGANDTTRLTTQVPLDIGGKTIAAGVYSVFVDLKETAWTLVLSTQPVQPKYDPNDKVQLYGAYNYDPKFDVLRAPMRLSTSAMSIEQFTIGFADVKADRGVLYMAWDRTIGSIDFTVRK
jgi:Protein of unknown function (DUF2911)